MTQVKICGIKDLENLQTACAAGAKFIGFVFYPPSPRHISIEIAQTLTQSVPEGVNTVGLFVDPSDEELEDILAQVPLDMIQLHGLETPERVQEIKQRYNRPIIKAISINSTDDVKTVPDYEDVADWLLFDTKVELPKLRNSETQNSNLKSSEIRRLIDSDILPGGTGQIFDWTILAGQNFQKPWMLSGGLTAENVSNALSLLKPNAVDISSGVESERGQKDPQKIRAFITKVKTSISAA